MKEAFEKIRKRIEDVRMGYFLTIANGGDKRNDAVYEGISKATDHALSIVSEVEAEYMKNPVYQYAMVYAKNLVNFGVDVRERLDSAVEQSMALNQAYIKGVDEERKRIYEEEFGKDINVRGNGWIPCSERLPEESGRYITTNMYEGEKEEVFDLWYEDGKWFIDAGEDETIRIVIAWMSLPSPYAPTTD